MKKGEKEIAGVTDVERPNRLGAKRRMNIIKTFALDKKKDDVRKYVVSREIKRKDKTFYKSPKIQRLITETRLRRKHQHKAEVVGRNKTTRANVEKYEKLLSQYAKEKKAQKEAAKKAEVTKWWLYPQNVTYCEWETIYKTERFAQSRRLYDSEFVVS